MAHAARSVYGLYAGDRRAQRSPGRPRNIVTSSAAHRHSVSAARTSQARSQRDWPPPAPTAAPADRLSGPSRTQTVHHDHPRSRAGDDDPTPSAKGRAGDCPGPRKENDAGRPPQHRPPPRQAKTRAPRTHKRSNTHRPHGRPGTHPIYTGPQTAHGHTGTPTCGATASTRGGAGHGREDARARARAARAPCRGTGAAGPIARSTHAVVARHAGAGEGRNRAALTCGPGIVSGSSGCRAATWTRFWNRGRGMRQRTGGKGWCAAWQTPRGREGAFKLQMGQGWGGGMDTQSPPPLLLQQK